MRYRELGKTGLRVSEIGLGGEWLERHNTEEVKEVIEVCEKQGINILDCWMSEPNVRSNIGLALKGKREKWIIQGHIGSIWEDGQYVRTRELAKVKPAFEDLLARMQTDYIDFYLMHAMGRDSFRKMAELGVVEYLEQLKAEGRIRYLGFSFHDSYEAFEEILCYRDWDFCQIQLNYMDTDSQAGMRGYRLTEERNVPLVIMEPVKGGSLAAFAEDITGRFRALDPEASAASYALRWVGSLPNVKVILSGMSTMGQVEDNLKTFSTFRPLSDEEANTIDEIVALIRSRVQNGCTACRYCMPCPAGVDIPGNFRVWNTYHMYQNYNMVKNNWENGLGDEKQAKNCVKCGKCEKACPQKLHIREDLEKVQADMDRKEYVIR